MEIVYYRTKNNYVPLDDYFKKYIPLNNDPESIIEKKLRVYAKIQHLIIHFSEKGHYSNDSFSSSLGKKYSFHKTPVIYLKKH